MNRRRVQRFVGGGLVLVLLAGAVVGARALLGARRRVAAAKVGDEIITLDEVKQAAEAQLAKLEEQRFTILDENLNRLIGERLLAQEAKRRGVSIDQLVRDEIYAKVPQVTGDEVSAFMAHYRDSLPKGNEAELKLKVWNYLRGQKANERRQAFDRHLRVQNAIAIYLEPPTVARVPVNADGGFVRGASDAPVTIVEFSDFQCPYCKSVTPILKQLLEQYEGKVKLVFKDNPIVGLHPEAFLAHQAARCAADQGKFWEYHDLLFERSPRETPADLKQYASELKLDGSAFAQCLDSHKYEASVNRDVMEGQQLGITGTPTFFINGLQLVGAQAPAAFQRLIDRELTRVASR
jgi:protein-disulfide isomerase